MVRFSFTGRAGEHWTYEAIVRPRLWHASRRSDCRIWQNKTVPDILKEVLDANGIAYDARLKETYRPWEYLTQYRESDLNFISRLMEHEGIYYWFEHSAGNHLLVLGDHFSTHEPFPGYATVPWYPPDNAYPDKDHFQAWRLAREVETGTYIHTDYDFKKPPADLTTKVADPKGHLYDQYEIFDFPGGYTDPGAGQRYAEIRLQGLQAEQDRVHGQGRVRGATPGYRMTLEKHPRADQNRELLIVRAQYHMSNNAYEAAGGSEQSHFEVSVEAMPTQSQFRPRRSTPKPHTLGPETAVVVGPSGEEIYTNEHGQVKVKFFWDRYGKKDGTDSCWIRVSHPWAGMNYGGIHIPRINQEVIVDFLNGDPDYPIIIGRVYNADQKPPWGLPGNKTQSGFLTRSTKGGAGGDGMKNGPGDANALRFEDKKGDEQLWLHAQRDQLTEVENDETKWVGNDRRKTIDGHETSTIHKNRTETVHQNEVVTIVGNRMAFVGNSETTCVKDNRSHVVKVDLLDQVGQNKTTLVGKTFAIEAGESFVITCGQTLFAMHKDGNVSITAKTFNFTAKEAAQINATPLHLNPDGGKADIDPKPQGGGAIKAAVDKQFPG
jgi:type VI secretion system secreted protein VgrG